MCMIKQNTLDKDLQILHKLRTGGSGTVFLARYLSKQVAVKEIPFNNHNTKELFIHEASIAMNFSKAKNIVKTLDCFADEKFGYIIMEAMESDLLDSMDQFKDERSAKNLFNQVCKAIQHCHTNKIAHLDIKPENILLDVNNNAYLCDFGGSQALGSKISGPFGTVFYNAPETRSSTDFDLASADIFSLGVLLYILLIGTFPFPGETEEEVLAHCRFNGSACLEDLQFETCSEASKDLLQQMLQTNPNSRPNINQILAHPWF